MPNRPPTFDHLRKKRPMEKVVEILIDPDVVEAYETATATLERAEAAGEDTSALSAEKEACRADLDTAVVRLKFRAVGRKRYDALLHDHPPTDEQNEEHQKNYGQKAPYNADTFAPALIQASCVEPALTLEQVEELFGDWNVAEVMELFTAALEVNTTRRVADLGKVYG